MNLTTDFSSHYLCFLQLLNFQNQSNGYCPPIFDAVLCWFETPSNTTAYMDCPYAAPGSNIKVSKFCSLNGTWSVYTNYSTCFLSNTLTDTTSDVHLEVMYYIYVTGYIVSSLCCLLALFIFLHYRPLKCLRNTIHTNIVACFAIHNIIWLVYAVLTIHVEVKALEDTSVICALFMLALKYFICAAFCWTFVEGLFLFISVFFSFQTQYIRFWMCVIIGWGFPLLMTLCNVIFSLEQFSTANCIDQTYATIDNITLYLILIIIFTNSIILIFIIYVLFSKLKLTISTEVGRLLKGVRALIILCPLLGVNYTIVLIQPSTPHWLALIVSYYSVIISAYQGTLVAVLYCFKNVEVKECICRTVDELKVSIKLRAEEARRRSLEFDLSRITLMSSSVSAENTSSRDAHVQSTTVV